MAIGYQLRATSYLMVISYQARTESGENKTRHYEHLPTTNNH